MCNADRWLQRRKIIKNFGSEFIGMHCAHLRAEAATVRNYRAQKHLENARRRLFDYCRMIAIAAALFGGR